MLRGIGGSGLRRLPARMVGKARQGPGPFATALAHHVWRRGPLFRMRRALALRGRIASAPDVGNARGAFIPGLVSVVLPVYEQADLLGESIESVLEQTYDRFELIVVDDGSGDDVAAVLREYLGHPRVRILRQPNQKLPKALSNGFAFARGEFWMWTSADNLMHPEQLERLLAFLEARPGTAMVYADYEAIDDRGAPLSDPSFRPDDRRPATSPEVHLPRDPRLINVVRDNFIGPCFLHRSAVGRLIGDYDPGLGIEDYDYWMRVNHAFRIEHLGTDETLYRYRVHDRSLSGRANELGIAGRARALMQTERDRHRFYREPWTILDAAGPAPDGDGKALYLIDGASLETLAGSDQPRGSIVAAWFDDVDAVYDRRIAAARVGAVAFTDRRDVAARLDLLGIRNLVVDSPGSFRERAVAYANNRAFVERSRPAAERRRMLPEPMVADGSRHVVIQVDDFHHGGLENVVLGLAIGLRRRGLRVSMLILGRSGPAADRARLAGIPVVTIAANGREPAYRDWLRERRVDLVYAHYSTFGAAVAADLGIPFVQAVHNTYVWLDDAAVDVYRRADAFTTGYLCVSAEVARYADRRMGLSVDKMIVVPNGVDLARSADPGPLRDELGLGAGDFVFLNVASIHATKAQRPLIRAFAAVLEDRPEARLVLVGSASDADYERRLRRDLSDRNLQQRVILVGQRDDVARFYAMADAMVLPSFWEGWSLALTEAACAGLPLVATAVGGAPELLAAVGGWPVRPPFGSIVEVDADSLPRLLREDDPRFIADHAEAMRAASQSRVRRPVDDETLRLLGEEPMADVHRSILAWFLQGGQAGGARAWSRPLGLLSGPIGLDGWD